MFSSLFSPPFPFQIIDFWIIGKQFSSLTNPRSFAPKWYLIFFARGPEKKINEQNRIQFPKEIGAAKKRRRIRHGKLIFHQIPAVSDGIKKMTNFRIFRFNTLANKLFYYYHRSLHFLICSKIIVNFSIK